MLARIFIVLALVSIPFQAFGNRCIDRVLGQVDLTDDELRSFLLKAYRVNEIPPGTKLLVMADIASKRKVNNQWIDRIELLDHWRHRIPRIFPGTTVQYLLYPEVGVSNGALPEFGYLIPEMQVPPYTQEELNEADKVDLRQEVARATYIFAGSRWSTTARLSELSEHSAFKFLSVPGFNSLLIPFLKLDYDTISPRTQRIKDLVDPADMMKITFSVKEDGQLNEYILNVDLKNQAGVAEPAMKAEPPTRGLRSGDNAPIGEYYVSPVESVNGRTSRTKGIMPIQIQDEIVSYAVIDNMMVGVLTNGPHSDKEREKLDLEPMHGNIAEIGLGVLSSLGVKPIAADADAVTLANEKLTFHIGTAMSVHLQAGGVVGPEHFISGKSSHLDFVYHRSMADKIGIKEIKLTYKDGRPPFVLMRDDAYTAETFEGL